MATTVELPRYRCSGRVRLVRFLLMAFVALAGAMLTAWGLHLASEWGYYLVFLAPLLAVLPLAGLMDVAVALGHCRNPVFAGILGLLAGLLVSPGRYQADLVSHLGWRHVYRVDLLPRYLAFRMNHDVVRIDHGMQHNQVDWEPDNGNPLFKWLYFLLETLILTGTLMAVGILRACRAYDEEQGRWMLSATTLWGAGAGPPLAEVIQKGYLANLVEVLTPLDARDPVLCQLTLEYSFPADARVQPGPVFLTIKEVIPGKNGTHKDTVLAEQWQIEGKDRELLLSRLFPFVAEHKPAFQPTPQETPRPELWTSEAIRPVPEPFGGTIRTPRHLVIEQLLVALPLMLAAGVMVGLLIYGFFLVGKLSPAQEFLLGGGVFGALGVGAWVTKYFGDFLPNCYLLRRSKQAVTQRPDPVVKPDHSAVLFIEVIPRQFWGPFTVQGASDVGFLRVDREQGLLLFEGDHERWRISAQSIVSCEVEHFCIGGERTREGKRFFLVVLRVRIDGEVWERPIIRRPFHLGGKRLERQRESDACRLRNEILSLLNPGQDGLPRHQDRR